jgi:hypothetical protein
MKFVFVHLEAQIPLTLRYNPSSASCGILISLNVRYTCNTSMVSATATALRISSPAFAATPAAAVSRVRLKLVRLQVGRSLPTTTFPAAVPHQLSLSSGQKSHRTFWPLIPVNENWAF